MASSSPVLAKICLPHPYLTAYEVVQAGESRNRVQLAQQRGNGSQPPAALHHEGLTFTPVEVTNQELHPPTSNNTLWARTQRAPETTISWSGGQAPSLGQIWLVVYAIYTQKPSIEFFRIILNGSESETVVRQLKASTLAAEVEADPSSAKTKDLIILRSTFWQGAASPFGARSVWIPEGGASQNHDTIDHVITTKFPDTRVHTWHPRRAEKPAPGSVIYSRYIPSLDENFSMVALDYQDAEHLGLFHKWQNDPRVAKGWNETGTLDQHREYCRKLHEDPHILTVLARFQDEYFAYFEIYWGKEDHLGAYYDAHDFDRGRHSLVGEIKFRGKYRVTAWWSAIMHYIFLDDPRTTRIVGEPKATNSSVLAYDFMHGFSMDKFVDLPHKRSALMMCGRERFFQLCPLDHAGGFVGGTSIPLPAKL